MLIGVVYIMLNIVFDEVTKRNMKMSDSNGFENVLCIGYALDIGPIDYDDNMEKRKAVLKRLEYPFEVSEECEINDFFDRQRKDIKELLDSAETHKHICLWRSREPHNLCAFAYTCYLLSNIKCEITYIDLPEDMLSWSFVPSNKYCEYLHLEEKLELNTKLFYINKWIELKNENASMRAIVNGSLTSVDESFYDWFILSSITREGNIIADVVLNILNDYRLGISPYLIYLRIMAMKNAINCNYFHLIVQILLGAL